ncbi:nucleoporin autopeptidase [Babesia ovata]|uniref:Nucleoporin autopeptidase n=1 Tax=Babesia ovata TaxID=189622 RepID=A0A2H6K6V3_9APIC|nr:nucleoporin autopeptidase [Babesia ovata]GBE58715.1 nucleoporin autopeptidase [Babesia ovata]
MFGSTNTGTSYWSGSTQPNTNLPGAFNALGANAPSGQQVGSTFTGFGSGTTTGTTGFMGQSTTPSFGISQNTSLFGQPAQQPATTGFGTMGTTGGLFDQNKQGFMGNSGGLFGQTTQTGGLFGSGMNTTSGSTFGSTVNTGTSLFGSNTTTGGMWSGSTSSTFGTQIQGTEVATLKHFDGASITHISYEKPDTCQEEYRWEYYKKANPQFGLPGAQQGTTTTGGLFGSTQPTTTTGGLFGSTTTGTTTGGLFGSTQPTTTTTTGGLFGSTQPSTTTGGLFGSTQPATSGGLFGSTTTTTTGGGLFGSTTTPSTTTGGLFGSTQPTTTTGGLFGSTQPTTTTGGLFGSTQPSTTSGGLFGSTQPTTGLFGSTQQNTAGTTGVLGGTQPSTTTGMLWPDRNAHSNAGLFGSTTPAGTTTASTGLFGSNTGTSTSTGLFGSSTTSAFGGANKGLFGSTTTPSTTGTTSTGLFGSSNLFGASTTPATGTTGTTRLFGSTTTGTTGGGLFGSSTTPTSTSLPNVFGSTPTTTNTMTAPSTNIFGAPSTTGTTGLFGSTNPAGTTGSLFSMGSTVSQPFGSTTGIQQMQAGGTMRLGSLTFNWGVNTPSPGLRSFWTNEADLPPEAKQYLAKLANAANNAAQAMNASNMRNQLNALAEAHSSPTIPDLEDAQDRFGLRQVLKDLGVQIPRYSVYQDDTDEALRYQRAELESRGKTQLSAEAKAESDMSRTFTKAPKVHLTSKLPSNKNDADEVAGDTFLSLHNGGAKALDALRFQARGGHLRKPQLPTVEQKDELPYLPSNRSSVIFDKSSNATSHRGDVLTLTGREQSYNERPHRTLDDVYKIRSDLRGSPSLNASNPSEDSPSMDDANSLTGTAPKEPAEACPIFKLADNAPGHPPILTKEGYTTRPTMSSLRQMSDKQLANVMDFQVIREGFGDILWPGYTDVRQLNLDNIVDIAHRKVTLYGNTSRVHPVGEGLNKNAIVTLLNCAPRDYTDGGSITATVEQLEKLKDHTASLGCKFISANFKTGQWVYEAPYFVKNAGGDVTERKGISFTS